MTDSRGNFSSRIGFILAAAGSAVGLGNIWRFPYLAGQNGGAAFLFIYLIFIFLLCYPVMVGELAIGRAANSDAMGSYTKLGNKRWGYLGLFGVLAGILVLSFYNVVAGWAFGYFVEISFGNLLDEPNFGSFYNSYVNDISDNFWFSIAFMAVTALVVSQGIQKGVEAANKIMMPALYIILLSLIVYSLTLPNAIEGIKFYLIPDFSEVRVQTIFDGLRQAFFSLGLGMGTMITYGSYVNKQQNLTSSAAIISVADTMVAFLSGLMIFPLVFSQNMSPAEGPPLVFMVLPKVFHEMGPMLGKFIGGSFFLLLCFAALTSTISLLEVPTAYLVDQKKLKRKHVVWGLALVIFIAGLPSMMSQGMIPFLNKLPFYQNRDFLTLVSDTCDIMLTVGGCLMCFFITYKWKIGNMNQELAHGNIGYTNSYLRKYLTFTISYVCPFLLALLSFFIIIDKFFGLNNLF
ncbi:MAG: sodium-dependent transporter [Cyclobacteriaceae bacterium]|nr:sodium-dependent transporter [Cyclobacteriaceae bacterium]